MIYRLQAEAERTKGNTTVRANVLRLDLRLPPKPANGNQLDQHGHSSEDQSTLFWIAVQSAHCQRRNRRCCSFRPLHHRWSLRTCSIWWPCKSQHLVREREKQTVAPTYHQDKHRQENERDIINHWGSCPELGRIACIHESLPILSSRNPYQCKHGRCPCKVIASEVRVTARTWADRQRATIAVATNLSYSFQNCCARLWRRHEEVLRIKKRQEWHSCNTWRSASRIMPQQLLVLNMIYKVNRSASSPATLSKAGMESQRVLSSLSTPPRDCISRSKRATRKSLRVLNTAILTKLWTAMSTKEPVVCVQ